MRVRRLRSSLAQKPAMFTISTRVIPRANLITTWRKNKFVNVLMQTGKKRDKRIPDVPTIYELMDQSKTAPAGKNLATSVLAAGDFGRPYVMPPNTPAEQMKIIRGAFERVLSDEIAIAAAKKKKLELDPSTSDELEKLAKEVTSQTPDVVAKMKTL